MSGFSSQWDEKSARCYRAVVTSNERAKSLTFRRSLSASPKENASVVQSFTEELFRVHKTQTDEDVALNEDKYMRLMEQCRNAITYWSSQENGAATCQAVFDRMQDIYSRRAKFYSGKVDGIDCETCNALISAWVNSTEPWSAEKAALVLEFMEKIYNSGEISTIRPNKTSYGMVIRKWCRASRSSGTWNAAKTLRRYIEHYKADENHRTEMFDSGLFLIVIDAFSSNVLKRYDGELPSHVVLQLFEEMNNLYELGATDCKPNIESYNVLLRHWRDGAQSPWQANKTLEELYSNYKLSNDVDLCPNAESYNIVLECISESRIRNKAKMCDRVLMRMVRHYRDINDDSCMPTVESFNFVIKACATTEGNQDDKNSAFKVASVAFKQLHSIDFAEPNSATYALMLSAYDSLLSNRRSERKRVVEALFQSCCREGCVDSSVIESLRKVCSPGTFQRFVGDIEKIPDKWSRKIQSGLGEDTITDVGKYGKTSNTSMPSPLVRGSKGKLVVGAETNRKKGQALLRGGRIK